MSLRSIRVLLVLALAFVAFAAVPSLVAADGDNGAVVVRDTGCGYGADILQVTSPSGNNVVVCQGDVSPPSSTIVIHQPSGCYSFNEFTTNVSVVVTQTGHETVVCRFNPSGQ